jgi:hypothetical protein
MNIAMVAILAAEAKDKAGTQPVAAHPGTPAGPSGTETPARGLRHR